MRTINTLIIAALASAAPLLPAAARQHHAQRYEYNGRYYDSYAACRAKKDRARKNGAIVGAAAAGIGAAVLGANLGTSALIAGGGAVVGHQLGNAKKC